MGAVPDINTSVPETGVILLVEDREDDIVLVRKAFQKASLKNPLQVARSGEEAVAYLSGEGKYSNRAEYPLPVLVLLDLKMHGVDGFEVLTWVREQDGLRGLPVVVLTSSSDIRDVNRAYQLGANSFFVKEFDFQNAVGFADLLRRYWIEKSLKPETSRSPRKPAKR
jgi:CheY-like chemotaxis protein